MKLIKNNGDDNAFGLLGRGVEVTGDILFTDRLHVEGRVTGRLISERGTLIIGETGRVEAQVEVNVCVISGTLNGNVSASSRIEVRKASRVSGDLKTPVLLIEEGAVFNGAVGMGQEASNSSGEVLPSGRNDEKARVKGA